MANERTETNRKGAGRYTKLKDKRQVSISLTGEDYNRISKACREQAMQEGITITFTDMVRRALDICYPRPKDDQLDLFKGKK